MNNLSKALINGLSELLTLDIQSRALSGITYTMLFKDDKDRELVKKYMKLREEATNCGFGQNEVFRVYEVSNGYIFDMDLSITKHLTAELSKVVAKGNGGKTPVGDLIGNSPEIRRKEDMEMLAKHLESQFKKGQKELEVALFSRNRVPHIIYTGTNSNKEQVMVKLNGYAIRHWDIEEINTKALIPAGIRITKIEPCEIVPPKTGVRFIIHMAKA